MTHYVPAGAVLKGVRARALCGEFVFYSEHAMAPKCPQCHAKIHEQESLDKLSEPAKVAE